VFLLINSMQCTVGFFTCVINVHAEVEVSVYDILLCIVNFCVKKPSNLPNDPEYVSSIFVFSNSTTVVNRQNKSYVL